MSPVRPWPEAPFAGVAHLVERDLAKVEVASSSLVARSKKYWTPFGCPVFFCAATRLEQPGRRAAAMPTVRWTVGKGACVSAATAAERASSPAVLMTSPFGCLVFFYAAARPFVGADAPGGSDTRWRGSKNEGSLRMVGYSAGKPSAISPHSTNRGLPFFRLARMIVTDHTGRSDISQWSRTRLEISSRSCVKRKA